MDPNTPQDNHDRVVILFHVPDSKQLLAVSVKWLIQYGAPQCPETGDFMKYEGTYITQ